VFGSNEPPLLLHSRVTSKVPALVADSQSHYLGVFLPAATLVGNLGLEPRSNTF
jgi:hypothetical protein